MDKDKYGNLFKILLDNNIKKENYDTDNQNLFRYISKMEEFYKDEEFMGEYADRIHWGILLMNYTDIPDEFVEKYKKYIFAPRSHNKWYIDYEGEYGFIYPIYRAFIHNNVSEKFLDDYLNNRIDVEENFKIVCLNALSLDPTRANENQNRREFSKEFIEKNVETIISYINKYKGSVNNFLRINNKSFNMNALEKIIKRNPLYLNSILANIKDLPADFLRKCINTKKRWEIISYEQSMSEDFVIENIDRITMKGLIKNIHVKRTEKILKIEEDYILRNIEDRKLRDIILTYEEIERTEKVLAAVKMYEL
ncbi:hypothetical protein Bp8pS_103 [Bacillus phage vB_BpuM-BpSp]|nr:hypothetical protein Bp8pS_103 [Bacillus phage vB_BpuM-BpSp]